MNERLIEEFIIGETPKEVTLGKAVTTEIDVWKIVLTKVVTFAVGIRVGLAIF